jgi:hypothetical protein
MLVRRGNQNRFNIPGDAIQVVASLPSFEFDFRDDYIIAEDPPLNTPRTSTFGSISNIIDIESKMSIAAGELVVTAQDTPAWGDEGFFGSAFSRAAGRTLMWEINGTNNSGNSGQGWNNAQDIPVWNGMDHAVRGVGGSVAVGTTSFLAFTVQTGVALAFGLVLRIAGCFYFIKGGVNPEWTLIWVDNSQNTATLYPTETNFNGIHNLNYMRSSLLVAPFDTDDGYATDTLDGARSLNDTFTHEADTQIEWIETVGGGSEASFAFRKVDSDNYWFIQLQSTGTFNLWERTGGSQVKRASSSAGAVTSGDRCVLICDDEIIKGYVENALIWSFSSPSHKTATQGELVALNAQGVADIKTFPLTPSGAALAQLNAMAA